MHTQYKSENTKETQASDTNTHTHTPSSILRGKNPYLNGTEGNSLSIWRKDSMDADIQPSTTCSWDKVECIRNEVTSNKKKPLFTSIIDFGELMGLPVVHKHQFVVLLVGGKQVPRLYTHGQVGGS